VCRVDRHLTDMRVTQAGRLTLMASDHSPVTRRVRLRPLRRSAMDSGFSVGLAPVGLAATGLTLLLYGTGDARIQVAAVGVAACFACLFVYLIVGRLVPTYFAPRLLTLSSGLQLLALVALVAVGLPLSPPYHPFDISVADAPITAVSGLLMVPLGALLGALIWWGLGSFRRSPDESTKQRRVDGQRRAYLMIAAILQLLYWPAATEDSGVTGYVVRILVTALMVAPFLAGRDSRSDHQLARWWWLSMCLNAAVAIAAGSRSKALIPAVLFVAGYISALPERRRLTVGAISVLAIFPLLHVAGALGVARDNLGRGGLELLRQDHLREVFAELSRQLVHNGGEPSDQISGQGLGRMLAWTNVVVPLLTPREIPYRGFDGFIDEAVQTFKVSSVTGVSADELIDAGLVLGPARIYGFTVNSNTAVEFTLPADGWSRGGAPVAFAFSIVATLALLAAEFCARHVHRYGWGVTTILALPVAKAAFFDVNTLPLLPTLRGLILYMLLLVTVVFMVEFARRMRISRTNASAAPTSTRIA
jgi:hypothetical protein